MTRICVTGSAGRVGRAVVANLRRTPALEVISFDRTPAAGTVMAHHHVSGDLLDRGALLRAVRGCDAVIHLAGLVSADHRARGAAAYFEVNSWGTGRLLDAAVEAGVRAVVYASTSHVYGWPERIPIGESHPLRPESVYAASKLAGEEAVRAYVLAGLSASVVARIGNVYGPGFGEDTVVGRAVSQARAGGPILLRSLVEVRDFTHIDDVAEAMVRLAHHALATSGAHTLNVSVGVGHSVGEMAAMVAELAGLGPEAVQVEGPPAATAPCIVLDPTALRRTLGWCPRIRLAEGLANLFDLEYPSGGTE